MRTGSLYPAFDATLTADQRAKIIVTDEFVKPNQWFTQEVIVRGNHIIINVNGKTPWTLWTKRIRTRKDTLPCNSTAFGATPRNGAACQKDRNQGVVDAEGAIIVSAAIAIGFQSNHKKETLILEGTLPFSRNDPLFARLVLQVAKYTNDRD